MARSRHERKITKTEASLRVDRKGLFGVTTKIIGREGYPALFFAKKYRRHSTSVRVRLGEQLFSGFTICNGTVDSIEWKPRNIDLRESNACSAIWSLSAVMNVNSSGVSVGAQSAKVISDKSLGI